MITKSQRLFRFIDVVIAKGNVVPFTVLGCNILPYEGGKLCTAIHGLVCASAEHMTRSSVKCKLVVSCVMDWCHVTAELSCVCCCVAVLGDNFLKYMEAFKPFLAIGLKNHEEHQVCDYLCLSYCFQLGELRTNSIHLEFGLDEFCISLILYAVPDPNVIC